MPAAFYQYPLTAGAVDLATALGITDPAIISCDLVRIIQNPAAVNPAYLGGPLVTAVPANAGFVFPVVAANIGPLLFELTGDSSTLDLRAIYVIGTVNAANFLHISIKY